VFGKNLSTWAALNGADPKALTVELLNKLLGLPAPLSAHHPILTISTASIDNGATIPRSWHQLLTQTEPQRKFSSPAASRLFTLLSSLPFTTRVRITKWSRAFYNTSLLDEDDDQKFFESIFGMLGRWSLGTVETTKRLFETQGYVPLNGHLSKGSLIPGSLESAFESAFSESNTSTLATANDSNTFEPIVYQRENTLPTGIPTPTETLLNIPTIRSIFTFDTSSKLRRTILSSAFSTAGANAAANLLSSGLFSDMSVNAFDLLLRLNQREASLDLALELLRAHTSTDASMISQSMISGIRALFGSPSSTTASEEELKTFAANHQSLARLYAHFSLSPETYHEGILLLERLAQNAVTDIFAQDSISALSEYTPTHEALAQSLYTAFGYATRQTCLVAIQNRIGSLLTYGTPLSFASWRSHAAVLACMDSRDLSETIQVVRPLIPCDDERRMKLRMDGFPLRIFEIGVPA
jgi:hypothetical protein